MRVEETINIIVNWLSSKLTECKSKGFIVGLSGGLDSSVTAVLCKKTGYPTLGLILPCHSSTESVNHAKLLAEKFNIEKIVLDLTAIYDGLINKLSEVCEVSNKVALGNLKARLRMLTLYYFANNLSYLVVGTGNKTEIQLGYFTKYGDGGVDLLPLGDLVKREVRLLGEKLMIPREILDKPPSADLWPGQTDEEELGYAYNVLDSVVNGEFEGLEKSVVEAIKSRIKLNAHKRSPPSICRVH